MNRGSDTRRHVRERRDAAFNEAPIHESGKLANLIKTNADTIPSMRPRFMNRGSKRGIAPANCPDPTFNEAPIHESGK